ncbi:hypothetical protein DPMN_137893 [Dreissena polymorpha]|uniref:Uncharacterized protein n=1 Tax=Dreissena polymorpha TaxID=45954 RepID=A0A9D4G6L8_DREPO|nr:hypothetical protein DPMN_137893 [Dreissena polymorpha]
MCPQCSGGRLSRRVCVLGVRVGIRPGGPVSSVFGWAFVRWGLCPQCSAGIRSGGSVSSVFGWHLSERACVLSVRMGIRPGEPVSSVFIRPGGPMS